MIPGGMAVGGQYGGAQSANDNFDLPRLSINDVVVCMEDTVSMGTTVDELYEAYLVPR